jgi:DDE superfamily endonuclease
MSLILLPCRYSLDYRGMRIEFLPPYSPDFNPIELAFSAIKSDIRRKGNIVRAVMETPEQQAEVFCQLWESVHTVTADDAEAFYHHCGYL